MHVPSSTIIEGLATDQGGTVDSQLHCDLSTLQDPRGSVDLADLQAEVEAAYADLAATRTKLSTLQRQHSELLAKHNDAQQELQRTRQQLEEAQAEAAAAKAQAAQAVQAAEAAAKQVAAKGQAPQQPAKQPQQPQPQQPAAAASGAPVVDVQSQMRQMQVAGLANGLMSQVLQSQGLSADEKMKMSGPSQT